MLDLEALAKHRGSLLGDLPGAPQPSQKAFESGVLAALDRLDPSRPVFVESESKRIGRLQVPDLLLDAMRVSPCVRVDLPLELRVALLKEEYAHFLADPTLLAERLEPLMPLHGRQRSTAGTRSRAPAPSTRWSPSCWSRTTTRAMPAPSSAISRPTRRPPSSRRPALTATRFAARRARADRGR